MNIHKILSAAAVLFVMGTVTLCSTVTAAAVGNSENLSTSDEVQEYELTITDVTNIQKYIADIVDLPDEKLTLYDQNGDGWIDISDATFTQKVIAKIIEIPTPKLDKSEITLKAGEYAVLSVAVDGNYKFTGSWFAGSGDVAEVDQNGKILAREEGTTTVTYHMSNGTRISCKVTVAGKVEPVLDKTKSTLKVGESETLKVTVDENSYLDGEWTSSNSEVATVDKSGKIFAKSEGTTTVTYTLTNGNAASCKVTVSGTVVKCFDISAWQPANIDFATVKSKGYSYVIIRAGYGRETYQEDSHFANYYTAAKKAGLKVGVYWYSYATSASEAEKEAKTCLKILNGREFDLPVYYDIEEKSTLNSGAAQSIAETFCAKIVKSGYSAGVYASASVFNNYLDRSALVKKGYSIWNAHWGVDKPTIGCDIWQYSSEGKISTIDGNVDLDYIYNLNILNE